MKHKRFSDEKIIGVLKEQEAGAKVDEICRRHGISSATCLTPGGRSTVAWRRVMTAIGTPLVRVTMAVRLKALEAENAKLKRIVAEQMLDMSAMKELLQKHW